MESKNIDNKYEDILLEKKGAIAYLTLNVPEKMNALTNAMRKNLVLARDAIAADDEVKVVIVTGAGRGFCSGADIKRDRTQENLSHYHRFQIAAPELAMLFALLDKPVIGAINGPAMGVGFALAMACDIRIASDRAKFCSIYIMRSIIPDGGLCYVLPAEIGMSKALELIFTGKMIDAAEAERLGIVNRVIPHDQLMSAAQELAANIAQRTAFSLALTKRVVRRRHVEDLMRVTEWETYAQRMAVDSDEFKETKRREAESGVIRK